MIALDVRGGNHLGSLDGVFATDSFLVTDEHIFFVDMSNEFFMADLATAEVIRRINVSQKSRLLA
ncbi:MAG: hypothetical protein ACRDJW_04465 [Thermomicrobiales bacterium]